MRSPDSTQFSIKMQTKNKLDRYKAQNKEQILAKFKKKRRMVSNDDVINYMLGNVGMRK